MPESHIFTNVFGTIVLTGSANGAGNTTISNLEIGTYLVLIEGGVKIYQPIAVNVIPKYNDVTGNWEIDNQTITNTKSTLPEITKAVDVKNITINTKATYTIDATIPSYPANATANSFVVSDKLPAGLTYIGDIKFYGMTGDVPSELTADTHYTLSTGVTLTDVDFAISFKYHYYIVGIVIALSIVLVAMIIIVIIAKIRKRIRKNEQKKSMANLIIIITATKYICKTSVKRCAMRFQKLK